MKINIVKYSIGLVALAFASSCSPTLDDVEIKKSTADFSNYVAVGNSLTAGYADGGLYLDGQKVAFTNLIASQMQQVGGGEFISPFFSEDQSNGSGYIRLKALVDGLPVTEPVTDKLAIRGIIEVPNKEPKKLYTKFTGTKINNIGVPGMRLDMASAPGMGTVMGNPYFERLLPENTPQTMRYVDYANSQSHTFFTFWLGNNDVLGYAMNGAVAPEDDPTKVLTDVNLFKQLYATFIDGLTAQQQKGAIATIPDVTAVPFFTTVTFAQILAGVQQQAPQVKDIYIKTKTIPRAATDEDLFILTFPRTELGKPNADGYPYGLDPRNPIADQYVLDKDEVKQVQQQVTDYNKIITQVAEAKELALVDVHGFFNKVKTGYVYDGLPISSKFISGNAFSLDGVHLTPIGNAIVANLFIQAINKKYDASIPIVNVSQYSGVKMPN